MLSRRIFLEHHLRRNLHPPLRSEYIGLAELVIELANDGEFRAPIGLPGEGSLTALEWIDLLRLETFVDTFDL